MPTIYADTKDGIIGRVGEATHAGARDAGTGNAISTSGTSTSAYLYNAQPARGGGLDYQVRRIFYYFDTSGITATLSAATFNIRRTTSDPTGTQTLVKSTAFGGDGGTALANSDFDALVGFTAGASMAGNTTDYTDFYSTDIWGTSNNFADTPITLNSTALSDMVSNDYLIFTLVDYTYDYRNHDPGTIATALAPFYYADMTGTASDPKIDYTVAGYSHDVSGVAAANIASIDGVATANISEVIGI